MGLKPRISGKQVLDAKSAAIVAEAAAWGARDAKRALDSGDWSYHKNTTGLSTLELIDGYWSVREQDVLTQVQSGGFTESEQKTLMPKLFAEYKRTWRSVVKVSRPFYN